MYFYMFDTYKKSIIYSSTCLTFVKKVNLVVTNVNENSELINN